MRVEEKSDHCIDLVLRQWGSTNIVSEQNKEQMWVRFQKQNWQMWYLNLSDFGGRGEIIRRFWIYIPG